MKTLISILELEEDNNLHISRLLILLRKFGGRKGTKEMSSLTKLAKLDFLLRYPVLLEKALVIKNIDGISLQIKPYERNSIESKMVRFKYGPWDFRYRRFLSILFSKGLINLKVTKRTHYIGLTRRGIEIANNLSSTNTFRDFVMRSEFLRKSFDISGTALKNFIYESFPEILDYRYGDVIDYETIQI